MLRGQRIGGHRIRRAEFAAGDVDQVGDDGARGRAVAGAGALEQQPADEIAFRDDGIGRSVTCASGWLSGTRCGMDALEQPPVLAGIGHAEQAHAIAERRCLGDVGGDDVAHTGDRHMVEGGLGAEREAGEDRELVRGVDAVDVEAGIGFGIPEPLRLARGCRRSRALPLPSWRG
jgi:hypothetical protein